MSNEKGVSTNSRISRVKESATLAVMTKAAKLKSEGVKVFDLSTGEPEIDLPEHIKEGAYQAIRDGKNRYTPVAGIPELRAAIAEKLKRDNGLDYTTQQIIVTNGGKQALHTLLDVTLEPNDEVLIVAPYWVSFPAMVELSSGVPKIINPGLKANYKLTPSLLKSSITPKTRALIINSPSNPCGVCYSREELAALGAVIEESNLFVISDEVYEKITFGDFKHTAFVAACPQLANRTVTVNAFSKSFAMTGWRVGYAAGPQEVISAMIKHQGQSTSNVNSVAQWAALAGLSGDQSFISAMARRFEGRIARVAEHLRSVPGLEIPFTPEGAFYLFVRIDKLLKANGGRFSDSAEFCTFLLEQAKVAVVPGAAFGDDGAFRMSVGATDASIDQAVAALAGALR